MPWGGNDKQTSSVSVCPEIRIMITTGSVPKKKVCPLFKTKPESVLNNRIILHLPLSIAFLPYFSLSLSLNTTLVLITKRYIILQ